MKSFSTSWSSVGGRFGFLIVLLAAAAGLPLKPALAQAPSLTAVSPARSATHALPAASPVSGFDTNRNSRAGTLDNGKVFPQQRGGQMSGAQGGAVRTTTPAAGPLGGGSQMPNGAASKKILSGGGVTTNVVVGPGGGGSTSGSGPTLTSLSPSNGLVGTIVTLTGTYFTDATGVSFNGMAATTFTVTNAITATATVPAGATTGNVTITTLNSTSNGVFFTLGAPQAPNLTSLSPVRNATNAPPAASPGFGFDTSMDGGAATLGSVKVFSQQRGGRLQNGVGGTTSVNGSTLTLKPTTNFRPGETIYTTVTTAAQSAGGVALARPSVQQFTVAAGVGPATFFPGSDPSVGTGPYSVALGDVDGDGDLDLLTANFDANTVSVRLNNGAGVFGNGSEISVGTIPGSVALGDVDGDGDLDLLTANYYVSTVSVRLNNGAGVFGNGSEISVGFHPESVALGDVDGDGDLDLLTANVGANTVSVRLNNGAGVFGPGPEISVGTSPRSMALGDVDGDGDLDLLTANFNANTVSVRLNDGHGIFSGGSDPGVGTSPESVALGDVDGDGDLDLLTANYDAGTVSVRLNNGAGVFGGSSDFGVGTGPYSVALGDVDGDGDLDLLTANFGANTVSVRFNDGHGIFSGGSDPGVGTGPTSVALGDVDGDGDLDLLTANNGASTVSVRLNQVPTPPTLTSLSPSSGPVGTSVALTGTHFTGATAVTFSGSSGNVVSTGFTVASATSITGVVVPAGAVTGPLTVTTPQGTSAASSASFTVTPALSNLVLSAGSLSPAFAGTTTSYALTVPGTTTSTTVTPTNAQTSGGPITVNAVAVASGAASSAIALNPGDNTITVVVNPVGAGTATTYTVTVTRCAVTALAKAVTVQLGANGTATLAAATVNNGSTASCGFATGGGLSVTPSSFTCANLANLGANTVTLTVTDVFNNTSMATAMVTVIAPPAATISSLSPTSAAAGATVTVSGTNLSGATALTVNGAPATISTLTATGFTFVVPAAATSTGNVAVSLPCGQGPTAPFAVLPTLSSLSPTSGVAGTSVTLTGTSFTGATGIRFNNTAATTFAVTNATTATATVPVGATTGYATITTPGGTSNGVSFTVCAPQAIAQNVTVQLGANGMVSLAAAAVNNGSTANCGFATGGGLSVSPSSFTCANLGANTVTLTVTDAGGNTSTATATVTVADGLAPSITAPAAVTRPTDANLCTAATGSWLGTATAADNCSALVTNDAPAVFPKGLTTVTWTATDPAGNKATATQLVTVVDRQSPVFATQPGIRNVSTDAGKCSAALTLVLPTASDNCAGATVAGVRSDNQLLTDPFTKGTTSITWTATDGASNTATYNQSIVVTDNEAPVARTKAATVTLSSLGAATITAADVDNGSTDNCGIVSLTVSPSSFSCATLGAQTVTLTAKDAQGNTNSATATVTVTGSVPVPSIAVVPATTVYTGGVATNLYLGYGPQSVGLTASGGMSYVWTGPGTTGPVVSSSAYLLVTATVAGSFTYTVTATSASGCTATKSVTLTVQDVRCGSNNNKVLVCHYGSQICINAGDVAAHLLNHHDPLGKCTAGTARLLAASPEAAQPPLFEAFPNPFTESTTLRFQAMTTEKAQLRVYNALGQLVTTLYDEETQAGQAHEIVWAGKDLAVGLYICRLQLGNRLYTQRVMLSR